MKKGFLIVVSLMMLLVNTSLSWAVSDLDACWSFNKASDYPRAIESGKKATKSEPRNSDSFYCLGQAYFNSGEFKLALQEMSQAELLTSKKDDLMYVYNFLGLIQHKMGETEQALQQYNRALTLARELGNSNQEASELNNVASIFKERGQLDQALEYYEKSIKLNSEDKNANTYNNIALLYTKKGEYQKCVDFLKKSIAIHENNGNYHGQAQTLLNLGDTYREMKLYTEANDTLFSGLEKIRKLKDSYWEAVAHQYIGWLYSNMGNISLARKWMKPAVDIYTRIGAADSAKQAQADLDYLLQPRPYAGIEIGAKGVKAVVLIMTPRVDEGYDVNEPFRRSINTTIFAGVKLKGAFDSQSIDETAKAVKELYDQISSKYKIDTNNFYFVGSSAVAKATNRDQLAEKVKELTGQNLGFITKDDEVLFNVIGSIPSDKISKALSIDIGSGNTKIGYWDRNNKRDNVVAVEIPLGTVSLADAVLKAGDDPKALSNAADKVIKEELSPKLRQAMQKSPGFRNRRPVYLVGGIVWAIATMAKPGNYQDFTKLTPNDVDAFISGIKKNPDSYLNPSLTHIKDAETRKWAEGQINSVKDVFTPENMLSGAKLLKSIFTEMKIKEGYFARWGSWLAGKVYLQAYDAEEQAAKQQ